MTTSRLEDTHPHSPPEPRFRSTFPEDPLANSFAVANDRLPEYAVCVPCGPHTPPWGESWETWISWANALPNLREIKLRCERVDHGAASFALRASPWSLNPNGAVNGGLVIAAADQAMGVAALSAMVPGSLPATATITGAYLRPAFAPLSFEATVSGAGRRLVFVTVDVADGQGRTCVRCSGAMAVQSGADR